MNTILLLEQVERWSSHQNLGRWHNYGELLSSVLYTLSLRCVLDVPVDVEEGASDMILGA